MTQGTRQHGGLARLGARGSLRARAAAALGVVSVVSLAAAIGLQPFQGTASAADTSAVTQQITVSRNYVDPATGSDVAIDKAYDVSVTVGQTQQLRDRQAVSVSWSGAKPTQGILPDTTNPIAANEEYPLVIMQCRGVNDPNAPAAQQIRPETCWTQSPDERTQGDSLNFYPPFRVDRYAAEPDRQFQVGLPSPLPAACANTDSGAQHWLHFLAADGTTYVGGPRGCAGIAPDAVNYASTLTPSNTTYGSTFADGTGTTNFVIQTVDSNASEGCSDSLPCSLVVIPIVGVSCDAAGRLLPAAEKTPLASITVSQRECTRTGHFAAGQQGDGFNGQLAVSGALWWSASNWRNRLVFPLAFAPPASVCDLASTGDPVLIYGSQAMQQATQQWAPKFCLDKNLFRFQHVQFSEPASRSLLVNGSVEATFSAGPPDVDFGKPVARAPVALSGFAIAFRLDNAKGRDVTQVNLTPRLLAKLMTMSYTAATYVNQEWAAKKNSKYNASAGNPLDLLQDPEFRALNPGSMTVLSGYDFTSSSTLFSVSSDSDVVKALSSYINADPDARAWLDGKPDPWGMVVNPNYKGIALPVVGWPILDNFLSEDAAANNPCLASNPVPLLPLVAGPVSNPITVTLNIQYGISNSQIACKDAGQPQQKLVALGRETPGVRALFGVVPLGDASRYSLPTASLLTHVDSGAATKFTDATGRTFVSPTPATVLAAAQMLKTNTDHGTYNFVFPYASMRTSDAGKDSYPGSLLLTMDVPTSGVPADDAAKFAKLMTFMATDGQSQGSGIGQLPGGYVPIGTLDGLGALQDYALKSAAAVSAQNGTVPLVASAAPSPSPTPSQSSIATTGGPTDTSTTPTDAGATGQTGASPSASPSGSATSTPIQIRPVGTTKTVSPGLASGAIPLLLALSAITGLAALATALWGRR